MPRFSAALVWVMSAAVLPASAAYTADSSTGSLEIQSKADTQLHAHPTIASSASADGVGAASGLPGMSSRQYAPVSPLPADDFRRDVANRGAAGPAIKFSQSISADKTGWNVFWRFGPVRGLAPLDGERAAKIRFGGRLPGEVPGAGILNISIHYAFD